ncbi:hypothetical protein HELRODRAFT_63764, partial [Helobdella robusta]|uniref:G-protein coupled receptors family 1 profile domain-containing protein n=1 Tax=Helobdella robusta TaxID=6412 RepID=T1FXK1_HELRO
YYLNGVVGMVVSVLGLVGNLMSGAVLTRRSMSHSSTYSYLTALAVTDFFFVLSTVFLQVTDSIPPSATELLSGTGPQHFLIYLHAYYFPYLHPTAFTLQVVSVWLTVIFTLDRYIMICHPFKSSKYCSVQSARRVIVVSIVCCFLFNLPKYFEYKTVFINNQTYDVINTSSTSFLSNFTIQIDVTEFGASSGFKTLYHFGFYLVFVSGLPFVVLFVCNMVLMFEVRSSYKRGLQLNSSERRRVDTNVMLIGVVVVFFFCQTPALFSNIDLSFLNECLPIFVLNEVANLMILTNSSINIVPYYFFGKKFREEFLQVVCCFNYSHSRHNSNNNNHCNNNNNNSRKNSNMDIQNCLKIDQDIE